MHDDLSKSELYRTRALECRKLAELAAPAAATQYEKLAAAYEQLARELEVLAAAAAPPSRRQPHLRRGGPTLTLRNCFHCGIEPSGENLSVSARPAGSFSPLSRARS